MSSKKQQNTNHKLGIRVYKIGDKVYMPDKKQSKGQGMRLYTWEEYKKKQRERALQEQQREAEKKKMEERFMNNIRKKKQANTKK